MKLSVASGKGGTGKTLVTVSLFNIIRKKMNVILSDIDVECPDAGLFIKEKEPHMWKPVFAELPVVNEARCTLCGTCVEKCNYKAIGIIGNKVVLFKELCKSCLRCLDNCPTEAITTIADETGIISEYKVGNHLFIEGLLKSGDIRTAYLIKKVKKYAESKENDLIIYDCPPGTTCPMVNAVAATDYCIVVAEDSPFGYSDFLLTIEVLNEMKISFGVIINKSRGAASLTESYCVKHNIHILTKIPYSKEIHDIYSEAGDLLSIKEVNSAMNEVAQFIEKEILCLK